MCILLIWGRVFCGILLYLIGLLYYQVSICLVIRLVILSGINTKTSLEAQTVKRLPTMWENWVRSLGQEDPLEKEMTTHSSTLAWKIPWMEECGRL